MKGIIFDLDETLIQFGGDWEQVARAGAEAMADWYLKKKHIKLDGPALIETFLAERAAAQEIAGQTQMEIIAQQSLRAALQKIEASPNTGALVEAAIKVFFEPEEAAWSPDPEAVETLKLLKSQGYRVGLYANISDDSLCQRLINRSGLRPWLSPTFSSAGWGWRKPKREAFELIAGRWGLPATEIVGVGDSLQTDIWGADQAGMATIWLNRSETPADSANHPLQPTAVIKRLSALPEIMAHGLNRISEYDPSSLYRPSN